jgi:hypothetical protein
VTKGRILGRLRTKRGATELDLRPIERIARNWLPAGDLRYVSPALASTSIGWRQFSGRIAEWLAGAGNGPPAIANPT